MTRADESVKENEKRQHRREKQKAKRHRRALRRQEIENLSEDANREMLGDDACYFEGEDVGNR